MSPPPPSCRLAAFFSPQWLFALRYTVFVRFESVCSSLITAHDFDEVMQLHCPSLADSIGSYFHMHAFSRLPVMRSLFNYISLLTVLLLRTHRPVEFHIEPPFTFTLGSFFCQ